MLIPGLVRQIWVIYPDKNSHSGELWGRKQVQPKLWEQHLCPMDTWNLYCIDVVPSKEQLWKLYHQEDTGEEGPAGHHGIHVVLTIFLLYCWGALAHLKTAQCPSACSHPMGG